MGKALDVDLEMTEEFVKHYKNNNLYVLAGTLETSRTLLNIAGQQAN
jgi:hypothetical protein